MLGWFALTRAVARSAHSMDGCGGLLGLGLAHRRAGPDGGIGVHADGGVLRSWSGQAGIRRGGTGVPKMKSHSGAKKRFSYTATGRVRRAHAFHQHNFRQKSTRQNRQLRKSTILGPTDAPRIQRLLPYGSR